MSTDVPDPDLFEATQDSELLTRAAHAFIDKQFPASATDGGFYSSLLKRQADANLKAIYDASESPIETAFFCSLQLAYLKSGDAHFAIERPPAGDIATEIRERVEHDERAFLPYLFYSNLPDDARPDEYKSFVKETGRSENVDDAQAELADFLRIVGWDMNFHSALHITMQPTFERFTSSGRSVRADALIWCPSNPSIKVVIECDGFKHHKEKAAFISDRVRDRIFSDKGYSVRRYAGTEIFSDLLGVTSDILNFLEGLDCGWDYGEQWKRQFAAAHSSETQPTAEAVAAWRRWKVGGANAAHR